MPRSRTGWISPTELLGKPQIAGPLGLTASTPS